MGAFDTLSYCSSITGISGLQGNVETMSYSSAHDPSVSGTNSGSSVPEPSDKSFSSLSKRSDHDSLGHEVEEVIEEGNDDGVIVEAFQHEPQPATHATTLEGKSATAISVVNS